MYLQESIIPGFSLDCLPRPMLVNLFAIGKFFAYPKTGSVFTNHSQEHSLSFSPRFSKFECNTTSDWLNCMV